MIIKDGTGNGYEAKVNENNQLKTLSVTEPYEHYLNHQKHQSYSMIVSVTTAGAACILYLKNEDPLMDISVNPLRINVLANCQLEIATTSTGTPAGGSAIVPTNMYGGASSTANGTFQTGANITGIVKGNVCTKLWLAGSYETSNYDFATSIIIPRNGTMTWHIGEAATFNATVYINYHPFL